jgi:hypothetical protein
MFGTIKANYLIEKAMRRAIQEVGMNIQNMVDQMPGLVQAQWRAQLRDLIKQMKPNEHELSAIICAPYIGAIKDEDTKIGILNKFMDWAEAGQVRPEFIQNILGEADVTPEEWHGENL